MSDKAHILVIDDEPDLRDLYEITLMRAGYAVTTASCLEDARTRLRRQQFTLVITDMRLPDGMGLELLPEVQRRQPPEPVIVITAYGSADGAVRALKAGAFDYLTKPVNLDQFRRVVASAVAAAPTAYVPENTITTPPPVAPAAPVDFTPHTPATPVPPAPPAAPIAPATPIPPAPTHTAAPAPVAPPTETQPRPPGLPLALTRMIGSGVAMQQLKGTLLKVAPSMAPVLVLGESGSGKELVARALHACSHRSSGPFVAVNCGAIPEALLEAEFFGAKKGAYTGSVADREGFFQAAHGGTLFLDEIGDLPLPMQAKLLRVIQERQVRPIGAANEIAVDVRIVSATHKNLAAMVQQGTFRQDLYYRLNVIDVRVPPLRERREDIPALALALLEKIAEGSAQPPHMTAAFMQALQAMPWHGNVRELENTLHRCMALSDGRVLDVPLLQDLPGLHTTAAAPSWGNGTTTHIIPGAIPAPAHSQPMHMHASKSTPIPGSAQFTVPLPDIPPTADAVALPCDLSAFVDAHERALLMRALLQTHFNRTAAAALLGLNLRQIRYRIERLHIEDPTTNTDTPEDDTPPPASAEPDIS